MGVAAPHRRSIATAALALALLLFGATSAGAATTGLVAAYSFDSGSGSVLSDVSGNRRNGTISGAVWTSAGRSGGALSFDGVNDLVTVADAASLDLTKGMTLEAWVRPTAMGSWRTVVTKEKSREPCLRPLLEFGHQPAEQHRHDRLETDSGHRACAEWARALDLDASRDDIRRLGAAFVRERLAGRVEECGGRDPALGASASNRREQRLAGVVPGGSSTISGSTTGR